MRKRSKSFVMRLNDEEYKALEKHLTKTKLSREAYIRLLINGQIPIESPPLAYHELIKQLRKIGTNLNQIAYKANALNQIDAMEYVKNVNELQEVILKIMKGITEPRNGNNRNLEG